MFMVWFRYVWDNARHMEESERQALELEEQFGIPSISLGFPNGGRAVIAVDTRKAQRQLREIDAKLHAISHRRWPSVP